MKKFIYSITDYIFYTWFVLKLGRIKNKKIYVYDIDNTLADSWRFLKIPFKNHHERLLQFPVFEKVKNEIFEPNQEEILIYLSARNFIYYFTTKKWLQTHGFAKTSNTFLVSKAAVKLKFLMKIAKENNIYYYDDLSYNHENGEVKMYENVIVEVKKIENVQYFDYEYLKKLQ